MIRPTRLWREVCGVILLATAASSSPESGAKSPEAGSPASPPQIVAGAGEAVFKGQALKFAVPTGWTVTQNDGTELGALVVLEETTASALKPTICLWLGSYDEKLANELRVTRGALKVRMAVTGVQAEAADAEYSMVMAGALQSTTANTFLEFKASSTPVVAAVMAPPQGDSGLKYFSISFAATGTSIGRVSPHFSHGSCITAAPSGIRCLSRTPYASHRRRLLCRQSVCPRRWRFKGWPDAR